MKAFLKKILIFFVLLGVVQLILIAALPYYHGNELMMKKMLEFQRSENQYNAVIFGSSRLYRHVDPQKLKDSLQSYNFYNFALPGTFNAEQSFLFENFVSDLDSGSIKLGIMELSMLDTLRKPNVSSLKGTYSMNNDQLLYAINYINASSWSTSQKKSTKEKYIEAWKNRLITFQKFRGILFYLKLLVNPPTQRTDGYLPLRLDNDHRLQIRRKQFKKDTSQLAVQIQAAREARSFKAQSINKVLYERVIKLISIAQSKGIHLVFVIPPKLSTIEYKELLPITNVIPKTHMIEMYDHLKYPFCYESGYSFDFAHLNQSGAEMFSSLLSTEIKKIIY